MSQLIKKVDGGYQRVYGDKSIIPYKSLIPHEIWTSFPDNFAAKTVVRPGIKEAEMDNEGELRESALKHAKTKGIPFFELYVDHSTFPSGNQKPQKYHVWAEAKIRFYFKNKENHSSSSL